MDTDAVYRIRLHIFKAPPGECKYCDELREDNDNFHPAHDASEFCKSGKRTHCSCDTCF
jgi:hypothetical protein